MCLMGINKKMSHCSTPFHWNKPFMEGHKYHSSISYLPHINISSPYCPRLVHLGTSSEYSTGHSRQSMMDTSMTMCSGSISSPRSNPAPPYKIPHSIVSPTGRYTSLIRDPKPSHSYIAHSYYHPS